MTPDNASRGTVQSGNASGILRMRRRLNSEGRKLETKINLNNNRSIKYIYKINFCF